VRRLVPAAAALVLCAGVATMPGTVSGQEQGRGTLPAPGGGVQVGVL